MLLAKVLVLRSLWKSDRFTIKIYVLDNSRIGNATSESVKMSEPGVRYRRMKPAERKRLGEQLRKVRYLDAFL